MRNYDYKDPLTFLEKTLKRMPAVSFSNRENPRYFEPVKNFYTAYKNLGILYQENDQPENAIKAYKSALEYTPDYFPPGTQYRFRYPWECFWIKAAKLPKP